MSKSFLNTLYNRQFKIVEIETHVQQEQKFLTPSAFFWWGASGTKQYT